MKKILFTLILFSTLVSCNSQDTSKDYIGNWIEVQKKNNEYVLIDCGYDGERIEISNTSILHKGIMEDANFKIDHSKNNRGISYIFLDKEEKSYYRFQWIDKNIGIAKVTFGNDENEHVFINKLNIKNIKIIRGVKDDCITNEDIGDKINDSLKIGNDNILYIEDENCISIKNKKGNIIFDKCFENLTIDIRHINGNYLPLRFISGQHTMDIDFFNENNDWVSNSVTYFISTPTGEITKALPLNISLNKYDFSLVSNKFDNVDTKSSISFNDIKNASKLYNLSVYDITDIIKSAPISKNNITTYNDAAYLLIEKNNFNEARIILLEIVKKDPTRVVAWLNLGDAQWGFEDNVNAKKSYEKYISLMKSQGKDLKKIPQRVYDRLK